MEVAHLATQELTVSSGSSLDVKEQVRQAIDIVDLVGGFIQLRRQGRIYVGLCPWHDDTRPSLQVNPERQSFKCWVCDIGGDIFSFVMKMEGVTFPEALAMLADRAGVPLKPARGQERAGSTDKRTLYQAAAWAEKQYYDCLLHTPEAKPAREYLQNRGISDESIGLFHLGFSPDRWDWILKRAQGTQFSTKVLERIGLLVRPQTGGGLYDRFRGRLLFSIRDVQGRPVGLGGRVLPDAGSTSPAKYVNSPETPLFSKSNLLYGLDVARNAVRKSGTALVTEGYTDCIIARQHGFENTVAVLGTALGERHIRMLKRFADRIVLVLDGDEAGQRRANEVLELFVAEQVDLRIVILPSGNDPCDFLQQHGAEAFGRLLEEKAVDALEHAFLTATRGLDLETDVHGASQALGRLVSIVAKAPRLRQDTSGEDRFREEKVLQRLARAFRVPETDVRERLTRLRRASRPRAPQSPSTETPPDQTKPEKRPEKITPWQRELLETLVGHPELVPVAQGEINPEDLSPGPGRQIYETCCRLSNKGTVPEFERLMLEFDDAALKNLLVELDENGRAKGINDPAALLQEVITSYRQRQADKQHPAEVAKLSEDGLDEGQKTQLFHKMLRELRARHGISDPTEG